LVTDSKGCTTTCEITISEPDALSCEIEAIPVICFGEANGQAIVTVTGGVEPYSYLWNNGETTASVSNLLAGFYSVDITDDNGAQTYCEVEVTQPNELTCSVTLNNPVSVNGGNDGSATITASGGVEPYSYLWDNGETTAQALNLTAGYHEVTVTDANQCETVCSITLSEPDALLCEIEGMPVICFGESNGEAYVTVTGGVEPYEYLWSNGETTPMITGLPAGLYTVDITDANGAQTTCEVEIIQPDEITLDVIVTNVSCYGAEDGTITAVSTGSFAVYVFPFGSIQGIPYDPTMTYGPGYYYIKALGEPGNYNADIWCTKTVKVYIDEPPPVTVTGIPVHVSCNGANDGSIIIENSDGSVVVILDDQGIDVTANNGNFGPGLYTLVATAPGGNPGDYCTEETTVEITEPDEVLMSVVTSNVCCYGSNDGTISVTASEGAVITINGNPYNPEDLYGPGFYTVEVAFDGGNPGDICMADTTVEITQPTQATLIVSSTNVTCFGNDDGTINIEEYEGSGTPLFFISETGPDPGYNWLETTVEEIENDLYPPGDYYVKACYPDGNNQSYCEVIEDVIIEEAVPFVVSISPPQQLPFSGMVENTLNANALSGTVQDCFWSVTNINGTGWEIYEGYETSPDIQYKAGSGSALFKLYAVDGNGCSTTTKVQMASIEANEYCALTPAFYGTPGGDFCNGLVTIDVIESLIYPENLVIGGQNNTLTIKKKNGECLIQYLPGGGPNVQIYGDNSFNYDCKIYPGGIKIKNGQINNSLLVNSIAMGLNLRLSDNLNNLVISSNVLTTAASLECGLPPLAGTWSYYQLPESIWNYFETNYAGSGTVFHLYELANQALAGEIAGQAFVDDISDAVAMINEAFSNCKWGTFNGGFAPGDYTLVNNSEDNGKENSLMLSDIESEQIELPNVDINLSIVPNPFDTETEIRLMLSKSTFAKVEVYDLQGNKIKDVFEGQIEGNELKTIECQIDNVLNAKYLICVIHTSFGTITRPMLIKSYY
jgi:hypothetical protein